MNTCIFSIRVRYNKCTEVKKKNVLFIYLFLFNYLYTSNCKREPVTLSLRVNYYTYRSQPFTHKKKTTKT